MNMPATMTRSLVEYREIRHFHLFCGLGGGAAGFNRGKARVGNLQARFRCIGGIDNAPAALHDFQRLAGVTGTCRDLFSREQYIAFHGHEPPSGWQEATPADIRAAAGNEFPHIVFLSSPCKGLSGLLPRARSVTPKYVALNELTARGVWLMLEAFKDDLPELVIFENVPLIASRGRHLLDQIVAMLELYGYAVAETVHDCGEIGNLAQSRKRFLLVARHRQKVPPFLFEPQKTPLRAVGDLLGRMPLPGDEAAGPMHRIPRLQWKTWVRLAFVQAGSDWRSLNRLVVENGVLRDYLIVPETRNHGYLGVNAWSEHFSIADPRFEQSARWHDGQAYGVRQWDASTGAVTGQQAPGQGAFSVADPRVDGMRHSNVFRIVPWSSPSQAVTAGSGPTAGGLAVADPRPGMSRSKGDNYLTAGHYGVVPWQSACGAVSGSACHDNGFWSVADPRLPAATDKLVALIRSMDGTWHRPFTTLELAVLQSLVDPEEHLELHGSSDSAWRERIGNAVPRDAAEAIASVMGITLLLAWTGETFVLGATPIWVRDLAVPLSVDLPPVQPGGAACH